MDSGAKFILTSEEGILTVLEMLKSLNVEKDEARKRLIVLGNCLSWAGGPSAPKPSNTFLPMEALLQTGSLSQEEKFEGDNAHETVYLCYSSVCLFITSRFLFLMHGFRVRLENQRNEFNSHHLRINLSDISFYFQGVEVPAILLRCGRSHCKPYRRPTET